MANECIVLYMCEGKVLMDIDSFPTLVDLGLATNFAVILIKISPYQNRVPKLEIFP